jgi:2',3'-cyclic-nucleotide 2'-phosphodiesterase (5'-nucleotidase family)
MSQKALRRSPWALLAVLALIATTFAGTASADPGGQGAPVDIQFLNISDWHAQLDPLFVFPVGNFGGAAELSTYFQQERANNPNTLTLTAGDAYGGSPPLSNFFDEEPAVRAMRLMGFDADTFGNHNFDAGIDHLQSMIDIAGDSPGHEDGRPFQYVSANLENRDDNLSGVKDFELFNMSGVKVAVIGITNPEAPTLVFPGRFGTIEVTDPVAAAMAARDRAERMGADIFVVVAHLGVTSLNGGAQGPLIDFANAVDGFDLIFGDHTNMEYTDVINGAIVVENKSKGVSYAKVNLTVSRGRNPSVLSSSVEFVEAVSGDVTPDPAIVALLGPLRAELDVLLSGVIGESTVFIPRADECGQSSGRSCESFVGDVTTDAMRTTYGTDFAITNSGGLRANLTCPVVDNPSDFCPPNTPPNFQITDGQVLTVLPFGNTVVTVDDLGGDELKAMLENGVSAMPGISGRFAQVSGLCFTYDIHAAVGSRVTGAVFNPAGTCSGGAVDLTSAATYSIAMNDFMASGGDGYPVLIDRATTRNVMDQDVAAYVGANTPISPSIEGRINCTTSGATLCPVPLP